MIDVFDDAVEALNLDITPHNLRDTAASLAIQAGASVVAVARLLGHESAATTLNHYAGLFPSDLDDVARRLNDAARRLAAASDLDDSEVMADAWDETDHLLSSPENARRLMEAIDSLDASHPGPSDTNEAPTTHRPERSEEE